MVSTLLVIVGVLVGLFGLLVLIVRLSARPESEAQSTDAGPGSPDTWPQLAGPSTQVRAVR